MLVLALDTSTPAITAGVVELLLPHQLTPPHQPTPPHQFSLRPASAVGAQDDRDARSDPVRVLAEQVALDPFGHAEKLLPLVTAALASAGRTLAQLDALVVGLGPGPFTGLRVGIVTAASLGDALDIPVHGVPSHDGLARSIVTAAGAVPAALVVTDARRREVHVSGYAAGGRRIFGPAVLAPAAVDPAAIFGSPTVPGAEFLLIGAGVPLVPMFAQRSVAQPGSLSRGLVMAAGRELVTGVVPGPLEPLYLRRPDVSEPSAPKSTLNVPSGGRS